MVCCGLCLGQEVAREGFILFGGVELFVKLLHVGQRCLEGLETASQTMQKMKGPMASSHEDLPTSAGLGDTYDRENHHSNLSIHNNDNVDVAAVTQMILSARAAVCQNLNDILRTLREVYISLSFLPELLAQDEDLVCLTSSSAPYFWLVSWLGG